MRTERAAAAAVAQDIDEGVGVQSVVEAFRAGINFFDTSPFYGDTKSETVCMAVACSGAAAVEHCM